MANRSEENKGGILDGETLKSFFAVTGEPGNFVHHRGQEAIPENWYKRPTSQPMNTVVSLRMRNGRKWGQNSPKMVFEPPNDYPTTPNHT